MHRERMKSRPSVPDTLASLYDILENSDIMQNVFKEKVITTDGKAAIILSTNYLLQALSSTTEIYVDGTFSVSTTCLVRQNISQHLSRNIKSNYRNSLKINYF